jgi:nucleoside-diphosphate-sugar epimerase
MKVLLTGATGFLGSHVAERLHREGHEVRALVRKSSKTDLLEELGAELCIASLESGEGLEEAVTGVDAIVHGAAIVKAKRPEDFIRVNAGGTKNLVDAVREHAPDVSRFVYISSLAAHGFLKENGPLPYDADPNPVTHYGRSKLEGEGYVLDAKDDIPVTILRPPAIYGPRDSEMIAFFQIVARRMVAFLGDASRRTSLIYATDCADAIYRALTKDHPSGRIYFVEDGRTYSQKEFVSIVEDALDKKAIVKIPIPIGVVRAVAAGSELYGRIADKAVMLTRDKVNELDAEQLCCPADPIREELGWSPEIQFEEGARRSIAWYRENGML